MVPQLFLIPWNFVLDHSSIDPAITSINATGHQLVISCRSIYVDERAQTFEPLVGSESCFGMFDKFTFSSLHCILISELAAVLVHLEQGISPSGPGAPKTCETRGDDSKASKFCRRVRAKRMYKVKNVGVEEVGIFSVTGAMDADGKASQLYCRICRKDVSLLTHGSDEILRRFQGSKSFLRNQRFRLETPGWRVLGYEGNPMATDEVQ